MRDTDEYGFFSYVKNHNKKKLLEELKNNSEILFAFEFELEKSKYTERFIFNETQN